MRWLSLERVQLGAIVVALALTAPSLTTGLVADDHIQRVLLRGHSSIDGLPMRALDLFTFAAGDPVATHKLMNVGLFPWWTDPEVRLAFWRPLSAVTHVLDQWLWPNSPIAMHAQNLAWFGAALLVVALFYRRFLGASHGAWVAGLAIVLYALDDAHGPAVGWIANRNAMVALTFALPAVIFHDRWRREGWRPGAWLAPAALGVGLLAGESAAAVLGYLAAHALHLDRGRAAQRLKSLLPYAGVVIVWRLVYRSLGYGTFGSGVYLDPATDPGAFLAALPRRLPWLLDGQFALPWSDFGALYRFISARAEWVMLGVAWTVLLLLILVFAPLVRRDPVARFFATGLVLAALPICATFPADRLLWFVGVGAMGLIAQLLTSPRRNLGDRLIAGTLIALHLVLAPPLLALRSRSMVTVELPLARANDTLSKSPAIVGKTMVLVNPPADLFAGYLAITRESLGEPRPARLRWLATGAAGVELERLDERTLRVRPLHGYLENVSEQMLRSPARPLRLGSHVALDGMTVDVTSLTPDGRPAEARFRFDVPLEDPSFEWSRWGPAGYLPFVPPLLGEKVLLPPIDFIAAAFGKPSTPR